MFCPNCHTGLMIRRFGRFGEFMGCTNHPRCPWWQPIQSIRPQARVEKPAPAAAPKPADTDVGIDAGEASKESEMGMTQQIETLNPAKAAALLAKNVSNNRAIVKARVEQLAQEMKDGRFLTTPEGIMIDTEGRLIDGQHRLSAIVLSGCTVKMVVWRNVPFNVMEAVNIGQTRTLADVLTVTDNLGVEGAAKVAVARAGGVTLIFKPEHHTKKLAVSQYEWVRDHYGEDLEWSLKNYPLNGGASTASTTTRRFRSVMPMGALIIAHKKYPEETEAFAHKADKGLELTETDPAYALRRYLDGTVLTGGSSPRLLNAYATFRCLYAAIKKHRLSIVRSSYLTEANPEFNTMLHFFGVLK